MMPFDTLSERLKQVATSALAHCKGRYGGNGVKIETGIDDSIMWRPTFSLKPSKYRIIAVEVEDNLYPGSLQGAAHEISHYDFPISVYQACSLEAYLADPKQKSVTKLKDHGFGIITVDDEGHVVVQHACVPLAQHISPQEFDREIKSLTPQIKVAFRAAYETYKTNEGQGLQEAGQIVEAIVSAIAVQAEKHGIVTAGTLNKPLAGRIDDLYAKNDFVPNRAALGQARSFINEFRNTASHPAANAKLAAEKIRKCRAGFLQAIALAAKLKDVASARSYRIKVYL